MDKLIIEAAINEQASKEQNPNVPYSIDECVEDAIRCADAGAAIVHFHARDPKTGDLLTPATDVYASAMRIIRHERPELLFYPTYLPSDRSVHIEALAADSTVRLPVATIDPGGMNFSSFDPSTNRLIGDMPFNVSHADCAMFFGICARYGVRPSVVVREPGHVRIAVAYHRSGMISGKILFKLNLADTMLFGLPPTPESAATYMSIVPEDIPYTWMSYVYGPSQEAMARYAIGAGAHVRTGLGDNPIEPDGTRMRNDELVRRVVETAAELGRDVATPREALEILGASV
jgi:3-keto-5-aminohexanoate cleavage enzyme